MGPFHQSSLEERENDIGGSPGLVPMAKVWFQVSGGEATLAHSHLVRALPTLKQLPWAFSSCLDSLWGQLDRGWGEAGRSYLVWEGRGF